MNLYMNNLSSELNEVFNYIEEEVNRYREEIIEHSTIKGFTISKEKIDANNGAIRALTKILVFIAEKGNQNE